jgi:hypothetical protein
MTRPAITTHADIAPAVVAIRHEVYAQARAERWSQDDLRAETARRMRGLAEDLRGRGLCDLADFVDRHFAE